MCWTLGKDGRVIAAPRAVRWRAVDTRFLVIGDFAQATDALVQRTKHGARGAALLFVPVPSARGLGISGICGANGPDC